MLNSNWIGPDRIVDLVDCSIKIREMLLSRSSRGTELSWHWLALIDINWHWLANLNGTMDQVDNPIQSYLARIQLESDLAQMAPREYARSQAGGPWGYLHSLSNIGEIRISSDRLVK